MARDFFIRPDLQKLGVPERTIRVLEKVSLLIEALEAIDTNATGISNLNDATDALNEALEDANLSLTTLDGRIDAIEALQPFVRQDQGAAWSAATGTEARTALAAYAGQTVSNPPTQVEVQAIDDAVKALSQHVVAIINDLKANGALT